MMHRSAFRASFALLAALVGGCDDYEAPTNTDDPVLQVAPPFAAVIETDTLRLGATFEGGAVPVSWDALHDSIATVSAEGLVTAVSAGFTPVTATQASPQRMSSASITVTAVTALTSGTAVAVTATAVGNRLYRKIAVPAGATNLTVTTRNDSTNTGNVDLFVRRGRIPTTANFDCASQTAGATGNNETCTIANPAAGAWYIMLRAVAAYSAVKLTATVTP